MESILLGEMEARFAGIIWDAAPVSSGALVTMCAERLGWKKSTTYTMLKRLCGKGLFANVNGTVTTLLTKAEVSAVQSESFVDKNFEGSLPRFLTAFTSRKKLDAAELDEIARLIAAYREAEAGEAHE